MSSLIPLIAQLRELSRAGLRDDLVAGLTTGIMLVPQAMAYAMLAGLPPIVGLYASTVPLVLYALLGTSRQLAVGPVAMVSLMTAAAVAPIAQGDAGRALGLAVTLAALVGVIQLGMGLARLGALVRFLSHPVIAGFTSAAALIIGVSQLGHLLGLSVPRSHHVHETLAHVVQGLPDTNPAAAGIGLGSVLALVALKRVAPRFPRHLLVVVGATLTVVLGGLADRVAVVGSVPAGLPTLGLPSVAGVAELLPMALAVALVSFMESISVAKHFARRHGYELDPDRELVALGAANLGSAVVGGYATTGGFSRTAVNAQAGARTSLAGLVTAGVVVLTLLFLTPLFAQLPKAALAAIILTAVAGLVDVQEARHLWRVSRRDLGLMAITFGATLTLGIEIGIGIGVAASVLGFVHQRSTPHVAVLGRLPGTTEYRNLARHPLAEATPHLLVLRFDASLFFANAAMLRRVVGEQAALVDDLRAIVLDASTINGIDASADGALHDLIDDSTRLGVEFWIAAARGPVLDSLRRSHLVDKIGEHRFTLTVHDAVTAHLRGPSAVRLPA